MAGEMLAQLVKLFASGVHLDAVHGSLVNTELCAAVSETVRAIIMSLATVCKQT